MSTHPRHPSSCNCFNCFSSQPTASNVQGLDGLSAKQQDEVHRVCSIIPDVTVQVDIFVEDEGEIAENDLVTIKVSGMRYTTKCRSTHE